MLFYYYIIFSPRLRTKTIQSDEPRSWALWYVTTLEGGRSLYARATFLFFPSFLPSFLSFSLELNMSTLSSSDIQSRLPSCSRRPNLDLEQLQQQRRRRTQT